MRILVCGSKHFNNVQVIWDVLDEEPLIKNGPHPTTIIHGCAKGVDTEAGRYAKCCGYAVEEYPADWEKHGKAAGPIRNKQMLDEGKPDLVIAFLAKDSRGTKNMIDQATKASVLVKVVNI